MAKVYTLMFAPFNAGSMPVYTGTKRDCVNYLSRYGGRIEFEKSDKGDPVIMVWYDVDPQYIKPGMPSSTYERYILGPVVSRYY